MNPHRFTRGQQLAALVVSWRMRTTFHHALETYARPYRKHVSAFWESAAATLLAGRLPDPEAEAREGPRCDCPGCPGSTASRPL